MKQNPISVFNMMDSILIIQHSQHAMAQLLQTMLQHKSIPDDELLLLLQEELKQSNDELVRLQQLIQHLANASV